MRRSSKKKRDLHSFREIKRDLYRQQKLKREELRMMTMKEEKKRISLAFTLLCLAISFALFFGFYYLSQQVPNKAELKYKYDDRTSSVSGASSASQQNDDESKLTQEQKELKKKIVEEDEEKFAFNWTLDNFVELKRVKGGWGNHPTLEEVIAKYGKASDVSFAKKEVTLTYKTRIIDVPRYGASGHPQEISLSFYDPDSNGKTYYLINKSAVYLDDSRYLPATKDEFVFKWKSEDMDTLKIGDWRYGKGGMTYQEVVERFGLPSHTNISGSDTDYSPLTLQVNYINIRRSNTERKSDRVSLIFKRQEDGSFCLADVRSEFDKSW